jgi:hypothetical protein
VKSRLSVFLEHAAEYRKSFILQIYAVLSLVLIPRVTLYTKISSVYALYTIGVV